MDLNQVFEDILRSTKASPVLVGTLRLVESGLNLSTGPVLIGIDQNECRHFLVPLAFIPEKPRIDDESRGIVMAERPYQATGGQRYFVDVACEDEDLNRLFAIVAQEMIEALKLDPAADSFNTIIKVLSHWRQLLGRRPSGVLSDEKLAGLWAELNLLKKLVELDINSAFKRWEGPTGAVHDFVLEGFHVECKATLIRGGWKVKVNGLLQLAAPPDKELRLALFRLARTAVGVSVPDLIEDLCRMGLDRAILLERLAALGYHVADEVGYLERRFTLEEARVYQVLEGFPRLIEDSLREPLHDAIQRLSYLIDLATAEEYILVDTIEGTLGVFDA